VSLKRGGAVEGEAAFKERKVLLAMRVDVVKGRQN